MKRFAGFSVLMMAAALASVAATAPSSWLGIYTRISQTCGGPGAADDPGKMRCDLPFEDKLSISPSQTPDSDLMDVSFTFHYGYGDYCKFEGSGTWWQGRLHLGSKGKALTPGCRLSLEREGSAIRVSDPGGACRLVLCTSPGPVLHGLTFEVAK